MASDRSRRGIDWTRTALAWGPVIVYMAAIFVSSAQPNIHLEEKTSVSDKTIHTIAYLGLALLAYRAAAMVSLRRRFDPAVQAFLVTILYGIMDEFHQHFVPGRNADIHDWLADVEGALIAVAAIILVRTQFHRRTRKE